MPRETILPLGTNGQPLPYLRLRLPGRTYAFHQGPRQDRRLAIRTRVNRGHLRPSVRSQQADSGRKCRGDRPQHRCSETLFRLGIAAHLIGEALFVFVALALYDLLKPVNHRNAFCMLTLILVAIPIAFLNELNAIGALVLVRGTDFLSLFEQPQRDALAMLFLNVHGYGFDVAGIFWGLWLFPLGLPVYRSGFLPRILGVALMANCFAFLISSLTSLVSRQTISPSSTVLPSPGAVIAFRSVSNELNGCPLREMSWVRPF
jgi:hypothetical protein